MIRNSLERWLAWVVAPALCWWLVAAGVQYVTLDNILNAAGIVSTAAGLPRVSFAGLVGDQGEEGGE